jgi:post-segregation antitoxin (ccd killing protein)
MSAAHDLNSPTEKATFHVSCEKHRRTAAQEGVDLKISWAEENIAAIAVRRAWIDENGTPLADLQVLEID